MAFVAKPKTIGDLIANLVSYVDFEAFAASLGFDLSDPSHAEFRTAIDDGRATAAGVLGAAEMPLDGGPVVFLHGGLHYSYRLVNGKPVAVVIPEPDADATPIPGATPIEAVAGGTATPPTPPQPSPAA